MIRLEEARERAAKATPGPWSVYHRDAFSGAGDDEGSSGLGWDWEPDKPHPPEPMLRGHFARAADATFIAASRTDLPDALDVVEAVERLYESRKKDALTGRRSYDSEVLEVSLFARLASWTRQPEGGGE